MNAHHRTKATLVVALCWAMVPASAQEVAATEAGQGGAPVVDSPPTEGGDAYIGLEVMPPDVREDIDQGRANLLLLGGVEISDRSKYYSAMDILLKLDSNRSVLVCFLDGDQSIRRRVADAARAWETPKASLHFDFGTMTDLRSCTSDLRSDIRISFKGPGTWSLVGKEAAIKRKPDAATMNFDKDTPWRTMGSIRFKQVVQHEFGHAIGLYHEHQNPRGRCIEELDWPKVVALYSQAPYNLSESYLKTNFLHQLDNKKVVSSQFDCKSIMLYFLPASLLIGNEASPCWLPETFVISELDLEAIEKFFPKKIAQGAASRLKAYATLGKILDASQLSPDQRRIGDIAIGGLYPFAEREIAERYKDAAREALASQ